MKLSRKHHLSNLAILTLLFLASLIITHCNRVPMRQYQATATAQAQQEWCARWDERTEANWEWDEGKEICVRLSD